MDAALRKAGETTNGNSPYETDALEYLNFVHYTLLAGGTIPIGKDTTVEIDEVFPWALSRTPLILELQPKYETGSVSLTQGSEAGTFSSAPSASYEGWYMKIDGRSEVFRIAQHTAASANFELDSIYPDSTGSALTFEVFKLDYDLIPTHITVDATNNKIEFQETSGTTLTGTITSGVYAISDYATAVKTAMDAAGASTYTVTYSSTTRLFTIASNRTGGGGVFILVGTGSNAKYGAHRTLGFDDVNSTDASSVASTYRFGGIARLVQPFEVHKGSGEEGQIFGIDPAAFKSNFPLSQIQEGIPERFCVFYEDEDGLMKVRFNAFPKNKTRFIVQFVPVPRDLKDSSASVPLIPRKFISVLEDAAAFRILLDKSDDRAQVYAQLAQGTLNAMVSQHRGGLERTGKYFGQIVSRPDNMRRFRRRNLFNYGYE